jgi:hypothetical protein
MEVRLLLLLFSQTHAVLLNTHCRCRHLQQSACSMFCAAAAAAAADPCCCSIAY